MKTFSDPARSALRSGDIIVSGAVRLGTSPVRRFWGGHGDLTLDGEVYVGIGARGLAQMSGGSLGGQENGGDLVLSGVDPDVVSGLNLSALRGVPVVIWRLIFNGSGATLLQASVYLRGRVDSAPVEETPGGEAIIRIGVEGAARGLGRRSERMRSDSDQRLISATDGGFRRIAFAGEKAIYWGGKPPVRAGVAFGGSGAGTTGTGGVTGRGVNPRIEGV